MQVGLRAEHGAYLSHQPVQTTDASERNHDGAPEGNHDHTEQHPCDTVPLLGSQCVQPFSEEPTTHQGQADEYRDNGHDDSSAQRQRHGARTGSTWSTTPQRRAREPAVNQSRRSGPSPDTAGHPNGCNDRLASARSPDVHLIDGAIPTKTADMTTSEDERRAVEDITARLAVEFSQTPRERVSAIVGQAHHELDGTPIRDFVAILVERQARERLLHRV